MRHARACPSLLLSAFVAMALAPAEAQAPRPGQLAPGPGQPPGPRGQAQPAPPQARPGASQAQQPAPPKPYRPIPVTLAQPASDPSFEAFRKQLGDIAKRKDRAALARLVVANNFFWMGEKGDRANKRRNRPGQFERDAADDDQPGCRARPGPCPPPL